MDYEWEKEKFNKGGTKQWADAWKRDTEKAVTAILYKINRHGRDSLVAHPLATSPKCLFGTAKCAEEILNGLILLKYTVMLSEAAAEKQGKKGTATLYMQNKFEACDVAMEMYCAARGIENKNGDSKTFHKAGLPLIDLHLQLRTQPTWGVNEWDEAMSTLSGTRLCTANTPNWRKMRVGVVSTVGQRLLGFRRA